MQEGYPTCFFAYCMCESVHMLVSICSARSWRNCHSLYQSEKNHEGHILAYVHTANPNSLKTVPFHSISIQASNFSLQTHDGAVTERGRRDRRGSGKMRDKCERWRKEEWGKIETKED